VLVAADGPQALSLAASHRGRLDLVSSDVADLGPNLLAKRFTPTVLLTRVREVLR
jgi:hypothetical protein